MDQNRYTHKFLAEYRSEQIHQNNSQRNMNQNRDADKSSVEDGSVQIGRV